MLTPAEPVRTSRQLECCESHKRCGAPLRNAIRPQQRLKALEALLWLQQLPSSRPPAITPDDLLQQLSMGEAQHGRVHQSNAPLRDQKGARAHASRDEVHG
jgi:hypothetical protein